MNRNTKLIIIVVALVALMALAIALTSNKSDSDMKTMNMPDSSTSTPTENVDTSKAVAATSVAIENYAYSPQVIRVKVGDTVTWTNKDSVRHDVVSDDTNKEGPQSELLSQGESYTYTFKTAGTYSYHCSPHPYMKATVIVE